MVAAGEKLEMPRGRMLSRQICTDEKLSLLSCDSARLLFTWMIPQLDSAGRIQGDPCMIKALVAPRLTWSASDIESWTDELNKLTLVIKYKINGFVYLCAPKFSKHQSGLEKESPSNLPEPPQDLLQSYSRVTPDQFQTNSALIQVNTIQDNTSKENARVDATPKKQYGEFKNVLLTDRDYELLKERFNSSLPGRIEKLSAYMQGNAKTAKKYTDHRAVIISWALSDKDKQNAPVHKTRLLTGEEIDAQNKDFYAKH